MSEPKVCDKVLCWVCNNPAVKKRIYCGDCRLWCHFSCAEKKKCCESGNSAQSQENNEFNSITSLISTINSLSLMVNDMKTVMNDLVVENKKLRQEIEQMKAEKIQTRTADANHIPDEQIFQEIEDRQARLNNIIISNLPESQEASVEDKNQDDLNRIKSLISSTGVDNAEVSKVVRIGKVSRKPRILKVTLITPMLAQDIVSKYRAKNGVYINRDLTRMQQNLAYNVRKEYKSRIANGENNIMLKYYKGIPKIITKNM